MLGQLSFGVSDLARAAQFYDDILGPPGYIRVWANPNGVGFGTKGGGDKLALFPKPHVTTPGPGFHLTFDAPSREAVSATYYTAFVIDLDLRYI